MDKADGVSRLVERRQMEDSNPVMTSKDGVVEPQERNWGSLGIHNYIKIAIIAALVIQLYYTSVYSIVHRWVTDSSWSHGFLIPFFSLYLLNQNKKGLLSLDFKPNYLGLICLILCSIVLYPMVLFYLKIGYIQQLIIIPTIASVILFYGGRKLLKYTWLPIVFLIFAIPLPSSIYNDLTIPMRRFATLVTTALLNLVGGIEATASGVIIDVVYKGVRMEPSLNVAEACSGMRLLMAFLALGVAMAYLHYRPVWQRLILLASTIPIAIISNVVRVIVTCFIYILWDPKYAQGIYHDMLGMLMLPLAFFMYWCLAWFMENLFREEKAVSGEDVIIRRQG